MRVLLLLLFIAFAVLPTRAQELPVTTSSEEAREQFLAGREDAFHFQRSQAIEHLDAAIEADPGFVLAYLYRAGNTPREEREPFFASAEANKDIVSEGEQRMLDAFRAFLLDGDSERAAAHFEELAKAYPDDPYILTHLAIRYGVLGRIEEAIPHLEHALELSPDFVQIHNQFGYGALSLGDYAAAEGHFREYIRLAPDMPNPYDSLGELYLIMGRYDEAIAQFEKALARDPDFTTSRDKLVRARIEQGNARFEEAFANQDADALATLYTKDAVLFTRHSAPTTNGRTGVRAYWADFFDLGYDDIGLTTLELRDAGEVIYESGIATVRRDGKVGLVADYSMIWKETPGDWKIQYDIKFRTSGGAEMVRRNDVEWTELIPGVAIAAVFGDWQAEAHGKLVRFDPGATAPIHTHTHPYRGVMLQGRLTNPYVGESDPPEMGPSDAWFVPGGVPHSNTCVSEEPCLFYSYGDAKWDIEVVEQ